MERTVQAIEQRVIPLDDPPPREAHGKVLELIRYWHGLKPGPGLLPGRQHFDPGAVAPLLPHLWLIEMVHDDPRRYRARLVGGAIVDAGAPFRRDKFISEVMTPEETGVATAVFDHVVAERHIDWRRGPSILRPMEHIYSVERAMIPLAADGTAVDMVLCISLFYWRDGRIY